MSKKLTPCLWFENNADQAAEFYVSVFKDGKVIEVMPYPEGTPGGPPGSPMLITFELFGQEIQLLNAGPIFPQTEAFSLVIDCEDQAEVDYYWSALTADGGEESACGWLKDKYKVSWQVVPRRYMELMRTGSEAQINAMTVSLMKMSKIDMAELEAAFNSAS